MTDFQCHRDACDPDCYVAEMAVLLTLVTSEKSSTNNKRDKGADGRYGPCGHELGRYMRVLCKKYGVSIIVAIHQPRQEAWKPQAQNLADRSEAMPYTSCQSRTFFREADLSWSRITTSS